MMPARATTATDTSGGGCLPLPWCLLAGCSPPPPELLLITSATLLARCVQPEVPGGPLARAPRCVQGGTGSQDEA